MTETLVRRVYTCGGYMYPPVETGMGQGAYAYCENEQSLEGELTETCPLCGASMDHDETA